MKSRDDAREPTNRTQRLLDATQESGRAFGALQLVLDDSATKVKRSLQMLLAEQLRSLRALEHDLATGAPSRQAWSYGQAAVPILEIILRSVVRARTIEEGSELVSRCNRSVDMLREALAATAEGRDR